MILEEAIRVSADSPMAFLRLRRIGQLLEGAGPASPALLRSKLSELADRDCRLMGRDVSACLSRIPWKNTQRDGYFGDPRASVLLSGLERLPSNEIGEGVRAAAAIRDFGPAEALTPSLVSRALRQLGDSISLRLAFVLDRGDVVLRLLGPKDYELAVRDGAAFSDSNAAYAPAGSPERPAVIYARRHPLGPRRSLRGEEVLLDVLAAVVRRYKIHEEVRRLKFRGPIDPWPLEFQARLEEIHWRATHGDQRLLRACFEESALGPALHVRDGLDSIELQKLQTI
jgi:hypothetical protein